MPGVIAAFWTACMSSTMLSLLAGTTALGAQETTRVSRLEIAIWPEYDRPAALVMLRGELPPDVALPVTVTLPLPAAAGEPHAVAKRDSSGKLLVADYQMQTLGEWSFVHLLTDVPSFRLEYYAPIERSADRRQFAFEWPGGLDLGEVAYEVLQPLGAEQMVVTPAGPAPQRGADGLFYHLAELGPKRADEEFSIELAYSRGNGSLSASMPSPAALTPLPLPLSPATAATEASPAKRGMAWWLVPVLLVVGALVGAGVAYLMRGRG